MGEYVTGTGIRLTHVHEPYLCFGRPCVIHNPMPGPWESWPTHWRADAGKMERLCPCGVGHPLAEDYERLRTNMHEEWKIQVYLSHACCGCPCAPLPDGVIDGEWYETPKALPN